MEDMNNVQLVTIEPWQFFGAVVTAIAGLWTMIWWYAREAQLREVRIVENNVARELAMGKVIKELESFSRSTLVDLIRGNQQTLM